MFNPSISEIAEAENLLASLLTQGKAILKSPAGHAERIREQIEEQALRSAAAQALALARFQWRPCSSIVLINVCTCANCGTEQARFSGFGVMMYRNSDDSARIVMTPQLDPAFPKQEHYTRSTEAACISCLPSLNFPLKGLSNGQT